MASVQFRIRSTADLIAALRSPLPGRRAAVLKAITAAPEKALAFEPDNGMDLIDELVFQVQQPRDAVDQLRVLNCLAAFHDDPRVTGMGVQLLCESDDSNVLVLASALIVKPGSEQVQSRLGRVLMTTHDRLRARLISELLENAVLPEDQHLRATMLIDAPTAPALLPGTISEQAWLTELAGAFAVEARTALERQGSVAFECLADHWGGLDAATRGWLLEWGSRHSWPAANRCLLQSLESGDSSLQLAALEALDRLTEISEPLQRCIDRLSRQGELAVRAAAIRAGGAPFSNCCWLLQHDPEREIRLAAADRLALSDELTVVTTLVDTLEDEDWRVRAQVTRSLTSIGEPVLPQVEPLMLHPDAATRAAALQIVAAVKHPSQ